MNGPVKVLVDEGHLFRSPSEVDPRTTTAKVSKCFQGVSFIIFCVSVNILFSIKFVKIYWDHCDLREDQEFKIVNCILSGRLPNRDHTSANHNREPEDCFIHLS